MHICGGHRICGTWSIPFIIGVFYIEFRSSDLATSIYHSGLQNLIFKCWSEFSNGKWFKWPKTCDQWDGQWLVLIQFGHMTLSCAINILKYKSFDAVSVYILALKQHQFSSLDLAATKIWMQTIHSFIIWAWSLSLQYPLISRCGLPSVLETYSAKAHNTNCIWVRLDAAW